MSAGKTCNRCQRWKPAEDFWRQSSKFDGRSGQCRACRSIERSKVVSFIDKKREIQARKLRERRLSLLREVLAKLQSKQPDQNQGASR